MDFVMSAVSCMSAIEECSRRLEKDSSDTRAIQAGNEIRKELSKVMDSLLRRGWSDDIRLNKSNVGKMLSLLLDNSFTSIPSDATAAVKADLENLGRLGVLRLVVIDVLNELPTTDKCKGPVDLFQTCTSQTFGCYYSIILSFIQKELCTLFESSLGKTKDPSAAKRTLEYITELVSMLQSLFNLTRDNEALAKKHPLLQQLKWGTRFIETFVSKGLSSETVDFAFSVYFQLTNPALATLLVVTSKAIPFFHTHFQHHQNSILIIIQDTQRASRPLYNIISHGKRVKDANLAKETPRSKKALELFIHKVKALLKKNRCLTAMSKCTVFINHTFIVIDFITATTFCAHVLFQCNSDINIEIQRY
jgi:hypothetical protein